MAQRTAAGSAVEPAEGATMRAAGRDVGSSRFATVAGLPVPVASVYSALLLAMLVGYPLLWPNAPLIAADTEAYRVVAVDMADGRLDRLWFRSPGYPFVMWLTGSTVQPTRTLLYLGLALHLAAVWLVAGVLHRLGFSVGVLVLFGVVMCLPPFVEPAGYALTENLTQFSLAGAFASLATWLWKDRFAYLVLSGAFIAFAALTRPTFQVTAVICATVLLGVSALVRGSLRPRDAVRASAIVLAVSVVGFGSFAAYNYRHHGVFSISPGNLAYSMTTKTVRVLEQLPDQYAKEREILIAARDSHLVRRGSSHTGEQYWPTASRELERITGRNEFEQFELMSRLNFLLVREAPLTYVWEVLRSIPSFWFVAITPLTYGQSSVAHLAWALFHFGLMMLFFLQLAVISGLTLLGVTRAIRARAATREWPHHSAQQQEVAVYMLALALIAYTMLVSCGVHHGAPRYRVPVDIFVVLLCILGTRIWWRSSEPAPLAAGGASHS